MEQFNCNMTFQLLVNLISHLTMHTGENTYQCKNCGKGFVDNINIVSHLRIHTGGKLINAIRVENRFHNKVLTVCICVRIHLGKINFKNELSWK